MLYLTRQVLMTQGVFEVTGVHHNPIDEEKLLGICRACRKLFYTSDQQAVFKKLTANRLIRIV